MLCCTTCTCNMYLCLCLWRHLAAGPWNWCVVCVCVCKWIELVRLKCSRRSPASQPNEHSFSWRARSNQLPIGLGGWWLVAGGCCACACAPAAGLRGQQPVGFSRAQSSGRFGQEASAGWQIIEQVELLAELGFSWLGGSQIDSDCCWCRANTQTESSKHKHAASRLGWL